MKRILFVILAAFTLPSQVAWSLWNPVEKRNFSLKGRGIDINVHPMQMNPVLTHSKALKLYKNKSLSFKESVQGFLGSKIGFSPLAIKTPNYFNLSGIDADQLGFKFYHNEVPVCGYEVKAKKLKDGSTFVLGAMPQIDEHQYSDPSDWPLIQYIYERAFEFIDDWQATSSVEYLADEKCYFADNGALVPAWKVMINIDGVGHRVIASQYKIYQHEKMLFDVTGKITGYDQNPSDGTIKAFNVTVDGTGYLENSYFVTTTGVIDRAYNKENVFEYETSAPEFAETTSFLAASRMYDFFKDVGYTWKGAKPLNVNLHVTIGGTKNNALYQPGESTRNGKPAISIGDGDGKALANLPYDVDVVAHEFGHHVVYSTLSSIVGESLVLHEGLADFFAFARSGDSCLGESICPDTSLACYEKSKCLRTASNSIRYDDPSYLGLEDHIKGQVVSGLLWDLHEDEGMSLTDVAKITYKAISLFVSNSGTRDLLVALLIADKELNDSKNACKIYNVGIERGFEAHLEQVDCKNSGTFGEVLGATSQITVADAPVRSKSSNDGCGTIGGGHTSFSIFLLGLMAFLPVMRRRD